MKKKLALNSIASLLLQAVTVISGFILPRMILVAFGSEVNGVVQSITQFLGAITFLELGVGQVIQSSLYKPLAEGDKGKINTVLSSGNNFFKKIAKVLFVYVIVLITIYPFVTERCFGFFYTAFLIIAICINLFAQYYFGIIDRLLLNADQRGYIQYTAQIIIIVINTIISIVLINMGASIHIVKFASSIVFCVQPIIVRIYIKKKYDIKRNVKYDKEPIEQKWNGIAQHVSAFILNGTDTIVLTVFSTLENVSIYAVYHLVVYGVHQMYQSATAGLHSLIGDLWAKQELKKLYTLYEYVELGLHFSTVFLFTCTGVLLVPFITVYTKGVTDVNYVQPLFGVLLVLAHACQCIKTTYNMMILGGGHYKQTQRCHIVTAALNAIISVTCVYRFGLIGVAIGTVISMGYQMIWMAWYDSKNLIKWPFKNFVKQIIVDLIAVGIIVFATSSIELEACTYLAWFFMAIKVAVIAAVVLIIVATGFYPNRVNRIYALIKKKIRG